MTADKHTFPIAMDEAGRLFINHRLCFIPGLGIVEGEAEKVGARWLRKDPDAWLNVGVPDVVARLGDADGLKGGHLRKVRMFAPTVDGRLAKEDGADFVDCDEWELHVDHFWSGQRYCGTIKGGSRRFKIVIGCQHGHGAETDWDLGNFADQGNERTGDGELTVATDDGSPVAVRYLSADEIKLRPPSQVFEVTKLNQGWFYPLWNFLKDLLRSFGGRI